uniref:Retrotransposon gag domain-containing protein n=1 Tax=Lactuca sativa TaxID=4236 RepID=A0A9R1VW37_LACSA|nr:hypothetical protein LSAT_V11C400158940 [Lactuca sativa]
MAWEDLKTMTLEEYCPRGEVQKLEQELWNLTIKDSDIEGYIARFSDLAILCPGMITFESKKVKRLFGGLLPRFKGMRLLQTQQCLTKPNASRKSYMTMRYKRAR